MTSWLSKIGDWFDARLSFRGSLLPILKHPIPKGAAGPMGWWYVFGSASLTLLLLQILTGIALALVYVPSADRAYDSLLYLNYDQPLGWFLRSLHYYAGSGMVVMVLAHMTQVFLQGAYKYPRELTWLTGVFLLLCTLGMFFTGQVLRWDPDAYWGLAVGGAMAGRVPGVGPQLVHLVFGGPIIGGAALSRFFALHVFIIPGALLLLLGVHLWLILTRGVSVPPVPGQLVDPKTYDAAYEKEVHDKGVPFLGDAMLKDAFVSAIAVAVVVVIAAIVGPKGPSGPPDPTMGGANPRPEWPFLWLFALLSLSPPSWETFIMLVFPLMLIAVLLAVPLVSNRGERAPSRRPVAVLGVVVIYTLLGILTYEGTASPWSPKMNAWSGDPIPEHLLLKTPPMELMGAAVFQNKSCRNCHAIDGIGGRRGPDLTSVASRLTRDQLIDQISNGTPGGGNMPAYGKEMNPGEMATLVAFLSRLRPDGEPPAQQPTHDEPPKHEPPVQAVAGRRPLATAPRP
ncbi:MAG TPA: cytochrome b N-terminal domain-containing protein [Pirellulales bacterium]|jgi:ubiquinol-cytochrome c reductase cytochrome b subunit|nr:cytochrome b N-terminal domain-containing protein [Pirellulales bacterium]